MRQHVFLSTAAGHFTPDALLRSIAGAPFEEVVRSAATTAADFALCNYCSFYMRCSLRGVGTKKHPLHLVVEYILSGACAVPAPTRAQLLRWIAGMDAENPILLRTLHGELHERMQAIRSLDPSFAPQSISLARWLFEGRSHIFDDMDLGRNVRRLISLWDSNAPRLWETLPSACRRCCSTNAPTDFYGYSSSLLHGDRMLIEFAEVIEVAPAIGGLTAFCMRCRAVTAVSFEYATSLRAALRVTSTSALPQTSGGHYARIAMLHAMHCSAAKSNVVLKDSDDSDDSP